MLFRSCFFTSRRPFCVSAPPSSARRPFYLCRPFSARVWDAKTGAELLVLKGHDEALKCVAVTPDGARVVTGSDDKTARVWDAKTGAELLCQRRLEPDPGSALSPI